VPAVLHSYRSVPPIQRCGHSAGNSHPKPPQGLGGKGCLGPSGDEPGAYDHTGGGRPHATNYDDVARYSPAMVSA
jgi:hypothetical protein